MNPKFNTVWQTPGQLSAIAIRFYTEGSFLRRKIIHLRPFICPFENLLARIPRGAKILDIGCGSGLMLCLAAAGDPEAHGIGVDVSQPALRMAEAMARNITPNSEGARRLEFRSLGADGEFPPGPFDVVLLSDVLHHVPVKDQKDVICRAATLLGPNGILLYKDMCSKPFWRAAANRLHDLVLAHQWIHYVPIEQVEAWALVSGLRITVSEDLNRYWYGHELRVFARADGGR